MWHLTDFIAKTLPVLLAWWEKRNTKTAEQAQLEQQRGQQREVLNDVQESKQVRRDIDAANDSDVDQQLQRNDWLRKDD